MSMPGVPQGRGEVGDTVASFPTYEAAQKAVSSLIAGDVPARDIAIVGFGLRSIERVTGKLGYATAARTGAINGVLLGLFFSAIFLLGSPTVSVPIFIGVLFIGVALGMLMSIGAYAIVRRRRDFASVMQVVADHYEVTVMSGSIHRAREIIGTTPTHRTVVAAPQVPDATAEPPRYGERVTPPAYGERVPQPSAHAQPPRHPDSAPADPAHAEPPRYGERIMPPAEPAPVPNPVESAVEPDGEPEPASERETAPAPAAESGTGSAGEPEQVGGEQPAEAPSEEPTGAGDDERDDDADRPA